MKSRRERPPDVKAARPARAHFRRLTAVLAAALLLAACDLSASPRPTPTRPAVATLATPTTVATGGVTVLPSPTPRACAAADLRAIAGWQGATGALAGAVSLANAGGSECALTGRPGLHIVDAAGNVLPTASLNMAGTPVTAGETPGPEAKQVVIGRGGRAAVRFVWRNWCGKAQGPFKVAVSLPGEGGQIDALVLDAGGTPSTGTPRCDDGAATSVLSTGNFEPMQVSP